MTSQIFLIFILIMASFGLGQWSATEGFTVEWAWRETRDRLPMKELDRFVRQSGFQPMSEWMKKSESRKVSRPKAVAAEALEEDKLIDEPSEEVAEYVPKGPVERSVSKNATVAKAPNTKPVLGNANKVEKDDEGLSPTDKQALYHLLK
jgi:hypothetical protein